MSAPILVSDPDDHRLEPYRGVRERDLVRGGGFIAEGEVVVEKLLDSELHRPRSLLLSERQAQRLLPRWEARLVCPAFVAPQGVLDAVAGFHLHRGVLAYGLRSPVLPPETLLAGLPPDATAVLLVGLSNHDNVGGVFRNAAAFGIGAVLLDPGCCDPLYRKAIRVSVGAALLTPCARVASAQAGVEALRRAGFEVLALTPDGRERLDQVRPPARAALVLGAEGPGLPDRMRQELRSVSIAMAGGFDWLNVGTAGAIALHHLWTAKAQRESSG